MQQLNNTVILLTFVYLETVDDDDDDYDDYDDDDESYNLCH